MGANKMKIQSINNNFIYKKQISEPTTKEITTNTTSEPITQSKQASMAYFKGGVQAKNIAKIFDDYKWFVHKDKETPIISLLKIKTDKESFEALVRKILSDDSLSYELIDSIVKQPRNIKHFIRNFEAKLPYGSDLFLTFMPDNLYTKAYQKYIETRMHNAKSISELLQIRPDWEEAVLLKKHQEIYHNNNFELGYIPQEIGHENFKPLVEYLKQYMDIGYKVEKEIPSLNLNGKNFNFAFFTDGRSDKNVFGVFLDDGSKFVIKIATDKTKSLDKAFALGTLCKIDTYLTKNHCRNSAPLKYYNYDMNTSIYDFIEHRHLRYKPDTYDIHRNIPDFVDLGLRYNDTVGTNNLFILDSSQSAIKNMNDWSYGVRNSEWVTVDNDHVIYDCLLQPKIRSLHKQLPTQINFL